MARTSGPRGRRVAGRALALVALTATLVAVAAWGLRAARERWGVATGEAVWIWGEAPPAGSGGAVFYAVRDFEIEVWPSKARLRILADEEYHAYVNGTLVGSDRYRGHEDIAEYEVARLLEPGPNRLVVELRSGRGAGGLLVDLEVAGRKGTRLGSDSEWRIVRRFDRELFVAGAELAAPESPVILGRPPLGRWSRRVGDLKPLAAELLLTPDGLLPEAVRGDRDDPWRQITLVDWRAEPLGTTATFDWGRELTAYVNVVFAERLPAKAIFYTGLRPPSLVGRPPPAGYLVKLPGGRSWTSSEPHRMRYLTVVATEPLAGARAFEVDVEASGLRLAEPQPRGLFGIDFPVASPPVDAEIRAELDG